MSAIREALETGTRQTLGYVLPTMRGDERQFEARVVPIDDNEVVTIVRDATELRRTERDLREAHDRLVPRTRRRAAQARAESARRRPAAALRRLAGAASGVRHGCRPAVARRRAPAAGRRSNSRSPSPRSGSSPAASTPSALTDDGLAAGARAARAVGSRGCCPVTLDVPAARLEPELEACTYYLVAEALANATKYAGATAIAVRIGVGVDAVAVDDLRQRLRRRLRDIGRRAWRGSPSASRARRHAHGREPGRERGRRCSPSFPCRATTPERAAGRPRAPSLTAGSYRPATPA